MWCRIWIFMECLYRLQILPLSCWCMYKLGKATDKHVTLWNSRIYFIEWCMFVSDVCSFWYYRKKRRLWRKYFSTVVRKAKMPYFVKHLTYAYKRSCTIFFIFRAFVLFCVTQWVNSVVAYSCLKSNWWLGIRWFSLH